mgnify:CR=1 FL=1
MRCDGCGAVRVPGRLETYPYPDDGIDTDDPIEPLLTVAVVDDGGPPPRPYRQATLCHHCYHRLDPDLWASRRMWESLAPAVPFESLPPEAARG